MLFWCTNASRQNNAEIKSRNKTPIRSIQINLASAYVIHTNQIMTLQGTLTCARHHTDINSLHWYFPKVFIRSVSVQFVFLGVVNAHSLTNYSKIELTFCWRVVTWTAEWFDIYCQHICEKVLIGNGIYLSLIEYNIIFSLEKLIWDKKSV